MLAANSAPIAGASWSGSWALKPRAKYVIAARVLHTKGYLWDGLTPVSSIDLALGWGSLSNARADEWISWGQGDRGYTFLVTPGAPYSVEDVSLHSANVHTIPATANLAAALRQVQRNDIILLEGMLVDVDLSQGYHAETSLTRADSGAG